MDEIITKKTLLTKEESDRSHDPHDYALKISGFHITECVGSYLLFFYWSRIDIRCYISCTKYWSDTLTHSLSAH